MRSRRLIFGIASAAFVGAVGSLQAQCAAGATQDACQKTVDLFNFLAPQISTALAGGSATIGQSGALGGFPHFAVGIRASAVNGEFPKMENVAFSTVEAKRSTYASQEQLIPMVSVDGALGLYAGLPLGVTHVGGIDALLTATYLPSPPDGGDIAVTLPNGSLKLGAGIRVGLLQESLFVPGVAFTYVQRGLPTVSVSGSSAGGMTSGAASGSFAMNKLSLDTKSWRISASKSMLLLGLYGGYGKDTYDNSVAFNVTVNAAAPTGTQRASAVASHSMQRTNMYVGASLNLLLVRMVAEVGEVSGGTWPAAMNTFGGNAARTRRYFSLGVRTGF